MTSSYLEVQYMLKGECKGIINTLNRLPLFSRQDSFLPSSRAGFPGIGVRHPGQHHTPILPQDQIGQVQSISVNPDTPVTREGKASKTKGEDGNDGWDANRQRGRESPWRGRCKKKKKKHERRFDKRSEETGAEESVRERCMTMSRFGSWWSSLYH